jgi:hypothetical protein
MLHELRPGKRASVLDHLWRRGEDRLRHASRELLVVCPEELNGGPKVFESKPPPNPRRGSGRVRKPDLLRI